MDDPIGLEPLNYSGGQREKREARIDVEHRRVTTLGVEQHSSRISASASNSENRRRIAWRVAKRRGGRRRRRRRRRRNQIQLLFKMIGISKI